MALSNAEKVRRYREKQKAQKQQALKQPTPRGEIFQTPFFEFFPMHEQIASAYCQSLELAGIQPLGFENDDGPEIATLDDFSPNPEGLDQVFGDRMGSSLGKAEVIIGCLLDAATDLASHVQDYKKQEIAARIAEYETATFSTAEEKREAFNKVAELKDLLTKLDRTIRWPVPLWKSDLKAIMF